jgi:hypothetical protein
MMFCVAEADVQGIDSSPHAGAHKPSKVGAARTTDEQPTSIENE